MNLGIFVSSYVRIQLTLYRYIMLYKLKLIDILWIYLIYYEVAYNQKCRKSKHVSPQVPYEICLIKV